MSSGSTDKPATKPSRGFPWRVFWLLLFAAVAAVGAALPLAFELFRPLIESSPPPAPLPLLIIVGVIQNLLLLGVAIGVGLLLARKLGLGAPLLESWLYRRKPEPGGGNSLVVGALLGVALGIVVLVPLLIATPYLPGLPLVSAARAALWKRLIVGLYGGIVEEILTRLFMLSLIAWLVTRIFQKVDGHLSPAVFWTANIISAILFGLGHLPAASLVMQITPAVVVLALVLNGIPAVTFGYLYWRRGLESAMIAHFFADLVLWGIGPLFLGH